MSTIWFQKAASCWNEALPLGNGRLGAMVFGGTSAELISMNEDSLWYGGFRDRVNPDARENLPRIRQLLREEKILEAQALAEASLAATPDGQRHFEPLCDLIIQQLDGDPPLLSLQDMRKMQGRDMSRLEVPVERYRRGLDLMTGVHTVSYVRKGRQVRREAFISWPDQVMALRCEGFPCKVVLRRGPYMDRIDAQDECTLVLTGATGDGGVSYAAVCHAEGEGVHIIGSTLFCPESFTLYVAAATTFREQDPAAWALARIDEAARAGYATVLRRHTEDFRPRMEKCTLHLEGEDLRALPTDERLRRFAEGGEDPELMGDYFAFGRYLLLSSSRPGSLPANLQGLWNPSFTPPWDSKYTININTEMNYWPAEPLNLSEEHLPLFDHILSCGCCRAAGGQPGTCTVPGASWPTIIRISGATALLRTPA